MYHITYIKYLYFFIYYPYIRLEQLEQYKRYIGNLTKMTVPGVFQPPDFVPGQPGTAQTSSDLLTLTRPLKYDLGLTSPFLRNLPLVTPC